MMDAGASRLGLSRTLRILATATLFCGCGFLATAEATVIQQHYEFEDPVIIDADGYHRVTIEGTWSHGDPGQPVLPVAAARILLPPGEVIAHVEIIPGESVAIEGSYLVEPGQIQYPIGHVGPVKFEEPDPRIYTSRSAFPGRLHDAPSVGLFRGYSIATVALHPVEYSPLGRTLSYRKSLDVRITTSSERSALTQTELMIRRDDRTLRRLSGLIDNPQYIADYSAVEKTSGEGRVLDPALGIKYVIITTDMWDEHLEDLVAFHTERGLKADVFLKSDITSTYPGVDDQEKIREFIIEAYAAWGIDYVLLVGDAEDPDGIPHRELYPEGTGLQDDVASDMYYGCLDGDWDGVNHNGYLGERGEADLYHEVGIGRACVNEVAEIQSFVTKTIRYQDEPIVSECDNALMTGEQLAGGIYGADFKDEIRLGSSANGYTTAGFPGSMSVSTLYQKHGVWTGSDLINLMETGAHIVNHLGHCAAQQWGMGACGITVEDIALFDNDGTSHTYNFVYSQGCFPGKFDADEDCFAEEFQTDDDGAVAIIMNSREGWATYFGTSSSSQMFDRQFFDAMFGEGIHALADANDDSKMDAVWAMDFAHNLHCCYELNLFGDPALELWTGEPGLLDVTYESTVLVGQNDTEVNVSASGGGAVEGARVTIYTDDYSVYSTGTTDGSGNVTLCPRAETTGTLRIKAVAHDFLVFNGSAEIAAPSGPYVSLYAHVVDDDTSGGSSGNDDGLVNAGETIELTIELKNAGDATATDVWAGLTTAHPNITITPGTNTQAYGDIAAGSSATSQGSYVFEVDGDAPDGGTVPFTLHIYVGGGVPNWESQFVVELSAPVLTHADHVVDDSAGGNGNGCAEPGETISLTVYLTNTGTAKATNVEAVLTTTDPYVSVGTTPSGVSGIGSGETAVLSPSYSITVLSGCPAFREIEFDLQISADWVSDALSGLSLVTSGPNLSEDVEAGIGAWSHGFATPTYADQWHIDAHRAHLSGSSWKFGEDGPAYYAEFADGGLVTPEICLGTDAEMTFWHWLDADEGSSVQTCDCGLVELSTDGGETWAPISPNAPYTHEVDYLYTGSSPLLDGTLCWSGEHGWQMETFDLSDHDEEAVRLRFRFGSGPNVTGEGWYIDDIQITSNRVDAPSGSDSVPTDFALGQNAPNPFNPTTVFFYDVPTRTHVTMGVYNIAGRLVKMLVDTEQEPGMKTASWDGTDSAGRQVASGVYMYRMEAGDFVSKRRMVLLK